MATRAVRNNNPGNLNAGDHWQGLLPRDQMMPEQQAETRFAVFKSPKWGFRALGVIIRNYYRLHGLDTVRTIIGRWAPPGENDTGAYVRDVCQSVGTDPDVRLDLSDRNILAKVARAIAVHESGGWFFSATDLQVGISMAETGV